jgi:hypothetical protein
MNESNQIPDLFVYRRHEGGFRDPLIVHRKFNIEGEQ